MFTTSTGKCLNSTITCLLHSSVVVQTCCQREGPILCLVTSVELFCLAFVLCLLPSALITNTAAFAASTAACTIACIIASVSAISCFTLFSKNTCLLDFLCRLLLTQCNVTSLQWSEYCWKICMHLLLHPYWSEYLHVMCYFIYTYMPCGHSFKGYIDIIALVTRLYTQ